MTEPTDPLLDVAINLRAIVALSDMLHDQAANRAAHKEIPGGEAMAELGPVANVGAVELRNRADEAAWLAKHGEEWCEEHETVKAGCDHRFNPWTEDTTTLTTLRWWTEEYRARTHSVTEHWTLFSEAFWLIDNLRWVYDNEAHWNDFQRDMAVTRARLEALLYAGEREERSTVPCIDCEEDRTGNGLRLMLVRQYGQDPRADRWVCPRCKRKYDEAAYVRAQLVDGARRGTDRFVPVRMAADALDVPQAVVKRIATACDISSRSLLVWWPDARAMHHARQVALEMTAV